MSEREVGPPADDDAVVEQVHLDVLHSDGLVEALGHQQAQQAPQVRSVVQGHPHLGRVTLQQWQQHGAGILPAWTGTQEEQTATD